MAVLPTVKVKYNGGEAFINEADYDPRVHILADADQQAAVAELVAKHDERRLFEQAEAEEAAAKAEAARLEAEEAAAAAEKAAAEAQAEAEAKLAAEQAEIDAALTSVEPIVPQDDSDAPSDGE
jgi:membrane protein involved in colicin uptake